MTQTDLRTPSRADTVAPKRGVWHSAWVVLKTIQARLRFVVILVTVGAIIGSWDTISAYYEKWTRPAGAETTARRDLEFFCPMHPQIVRDTGKDPCPICFMPLSRRKKGAGQADPLPAGTLNRVQLSPYRVLLGGVRTLPVERRPLVKEIRAVGFVEFDERKLAQIAARVKGRIDKLFVNVTGQMVRAGDEMALLYSPDLLTTVENLVNARRGGNAGLERAARERLRLWGIQETEIDDIAATPTEHSQWKIRSPINGHVIKKYQTEGKYVDEGSPLYDVADLSTVWIQAQIFEDELSLLQVGLEVRATTPAIPGREFHGRLAFVHPHLDQATRTLTVRFDIENSGHELRPGMYATVVFEVPVAETGLVGQRSAESASRGPLAVPEGSIIDTGDHKVVYREAAPGVFEGVEVTLGPRCGDWYPVVTGLKEGERVVAQGAFLVDAETRLNPAAGSIYFGGSGGSAPAPAVLTRPGAGAGEGAGPRTKNDPKIRSARAKLSAADRALAEAQDECPINPGTRLGAMGPPHKITLAGESVLLCCAGCEPEAKRDPAGTLAKVAALKAKTPPSTRPNSQGDKAP